MKQRRQGSFWTVMTAALCLLLFFAAVFYLFFTAAGSRFVLSRLLADYISPVEIGSLKARGSFVRGLVFQAPELVTLRWLPPGSKLKAQRIEVSLVLFGEPGINVSVYNGKLLLPWGDSLQFYGRCRASSLDVQVFTGRLSLNEAFSVFFRDSELNKATGTLTGLDFHIGGSLRNPLLEGTFALENASYRSFKASGCKGNVSFMLSRSGSGIAARGKINIAGGTLYGEHTAKITLGESALFLNGPFRSLSFDLKGEAKVEDTRIELSFRGTMEKPELRLTSQLPLSQDRLLLMLATDKKWQTTESALSGGRLPAEMAADFLDFFILGGSAGKFVRDLGIRDVSVKIDAKSTEVGATKDITGSTSIRYSLEQRQEESAPVSYHKLSAEYKITESFSLGAERVTEQNNETGGAEHSRKIDDKILLKFKTDF
ncbi:MAG: translocation/assembly module TamB domain-containing protein [Candidatus Omnitrophota bacterium]|jgi:autotransporter translocation and assembly factor TamB